MKKLLRVTLSGLLATVSALAATDVSGKWASAPIYLILKQEGNKLSGTGGPSEKQQLVTFDSGSVEGDRVTFKVGPYEFDLRLNGDEMKGVVKNGSATEMTFLKRVTDQPTGPRAFEVASVKRATPSPGGGSNSSMRLDPGRLTCTNVSLKKLIWESYSVKEYQVAGPDWISTEIYDIAATLPPGTTGDEVRLMIQTLLAERFKLTLRRETREMPVYALVVGKNGSKLQEVEFGRASTIQACLAVRF